MLKNIKLQVIIAASSVLTLLIIGTFVYHRTEHWTWIQSFYFSVVTLATVGYGDLHPTTEFTRLFTALYILLGDGIFIAGLSVIGTNYLKSREEKIIKKKS